MDNARDMEIRVDSIDSKNINFHSTERAAENGKAIFKTINFKISKGDMVRILKSLGVDNCHA